MGFGIFLTVLTIIILIRAKSFPSMMKNLAEGVKVFKKEIKTLDSKSSQEVAAKKVVAKKVAVKRDAVKKAAKKK